MLARVRRAADSAGFIASAGAATARGGTGADAAEAADAGGRVDCITVTAAFSTFLQRSFSASLAVIVLL